MESTKVVFRDKSNWLVGNVMSKRAEDGKKTRIFHTK